MIPHGVMRGARPLLLAFALSTGPAVAQSDDAEPAAPASAEGIQRLLSALQNGGTFKVRATAAVALGRMADARALNPLTEALRGDDSFAVRAASASALGRLGDPVCVAALFDALKDPERYVRDEAHEALARFHAPKHLLAFREALHDEDAVVRLAAVSAYGEVMREPDSAPGVAVQVVIALGDDDEIVSSTASRAISELAHDRAVPILLDGLRSGDSGARAGAARVLEKRIDRRAVDPLRALVLDTDQPEDVRRASAQALRAHAEYVDVAGLLRSASTPGDAERVPAMRVLAVLGDARALSAIDAAFADTDPAVRTAAARAAADSAQPKAKVALQAAVARESDPRLKRQLELILKSMR